MYNGKSEISNTHQCLEKGVSNARISNSCCYRCPLGYTVLKGLPFQVGQRVEVVLLEELEDSSTND